MFPMIPMSAAWLLFACSAEAPAAPAPEATAASSEDVLPASFSFTIDGMRRVNGAL